MPFAIDALWLTGRTVERIARIGPWRGTERASADTVIELPAGTAAAVAPGDTVVWEQASTDP